MPVSRMATGSPKEGTGVLLGNTLTGEFSRANQMRLRWPYVRRVLEQELIDAGWGTEQRAEFLARMEVNYKAPFPPIGEESLAGGLSNTIAGRICNHFDLKGGGYTRRWRLRIVAACGGERLLGPCGERSGRRACRRRRSQPRSVRADRLCQDRGAGSREDADI